MRPRRKLDTEARARRTEARQEILDAVGDYRRAMLGTQMKRREIVQRRRTKNGCGTLALPDVFALKPLTPRHLHRAVCIARRRGLVGDAVLVAAGFNPAPVRRVRVEKVAA
jgi:hypothetical protein